MRAAAAGNVFRAGRLQDLPALVAFLDETCGDVDGEALADLRLAVEEVFANIFQHGYGGPGPVEVRIARGAGVVAITLLDRAPRFDPSRVAAADVGANWQERRVGGLGWHLVRQVMDEVGWAPAEGRGNAYRLVRTIAAGAIESTVGQHEGTCT